MRHVDRELVKQASLRTYASKTAKALLHRGTLDAALFQALVGAAPGATQRDRPRGDRMRDNVAEELMQRFGGIYELMTVEEWS